MSEKMFMLDIETTGIQWDQNELLEVGILEMTFRDGFWEPGRTFNRPQFSDREPESEFAKEHMADLYARCNQTQPTEVSKFRALINKFFQDCGVSGCKEVYLCGWNASNFDVPFLVHHGYLKETGYETGPDGKDIQTGDFHYRIYEIAGAIQLASDVTGIRDREVLLEKAEATDQIVTLPEGKDHDAIYDCYSQLKVLNGLIGLLRKSEQ